MLLLATYPSSHAALRAEKRLRREGLAVELIPVPRQIHSTCGFCLLVEAADPVEPIRASGAQGLWLSLEPLVGTNRRRYEPYP